eukprot:1919517-Pleurochrysis_carterae.AAC.1
MDAAWEDLAGQLHGVAFRVQTYEDAGRLPQVNVGCRRPSASVCQAELGRSPAQAERTDVPRVWA